MQLNTPNHLLKNDRGKLLHHFKNWKVVLFTGLSISVGGLLAIMFYKTKQTQTLPPTRPLPTVTSNPSQPQAKQSYFLNTIGSNRPVTGYSWTGNKLVYSTPNGIYIADTNSKIVDKPISYISWSKNGEAFYQSQNQWFWLSNISAQPKSTTMKFQSPMLSSDGQTVVTIVDNNMMVINLPDFSAKSKQFDYTPANLTWSPSSQIIAFEQKSETVSNIVVLNIQLNLVSNISVNKSSQLIAVSPDDSWIAIQNDNALQIIPIIQENKNGVSSSIIDFTPSSKLSATWMSESLIVIETYPDRIGRKINYIWKLNKNGSEFNKELLTNTAAIPKKLSLAASIIPDPMHIVLPLIENQGELWLLSFVPNNLPSYSSSGVKLFPVSSAGD